MANIPGEWNSLEKRLKPKRHSKLFKEIEKYALDKGERAHTYWDEIIMLKPITLVI